MTENSSFWRDKDRVIAFAKSLGSGMSVVLTYNDFSDKPGYQIIHTENEPRLLKGRQVIHRT